MKAILNDYGLDAPLIIGGVKIIGRWSGCGEMVDWVAPAKNIQPLELMKIEQAGFRFTMKGDICELTTRVMCTKFMED